MSIVTTDAVRIEVTFVVCYIGSHEIVGAEETVFGAVGVCRLDIREVELLPGVEKVVPISKPYKLASRELKKEDTIVSVGKVRIGGSRIVAIAGPCAVESREQILTIAGLVRDAGAVMAE